MIKIKFYVCDKLTLTFLQRIISIFFKNFKYSFITLPSKKKKFTILKSPFVNKKAKEHYGLFCSTRLLILPNINKSILCVFLQKIPNNIHFKLVLVE